MFHVKQRVKMTLSILIIRNKQRGVKTMKLTNKMIEGYLTDCLGYDKMMINELKDHHNPLINSLNEEEKEDCINYYK